MQTRKVVLITGCSSGIGRALAQAFHARGCVTYATARNPQSLQDLVAQGIHGLQLDVTHAESVAACVGEIERQAGCIDILVNNAGIPVMGPVAELALDQLRQLWETNLTGPVAMVQAVVPGMARRRSGLIANVGSVSGVLTTPFAGPYCASKAALHSLSDALRMELSPFGIRVTTVQPGGVQSGFGHSAQAQTQQHPWRLYARFAQGIARRASASQAGAMPAPAFAATCVDALLADRPSAVVRLGRGARLLPALALLPSRARDRILMRRFGLGAAQG